MSLPSDLARALSADFEVGKLLGQGGAGWVVAATDKRMGREVALKVARRKGTPTQLARFEREGRIAGGLRHSNVVRTHSLGEVNGHAYLVLELVPGAETLRTTFESAPVLTRLHALRDVVAAMEYAHDQGIVHRDLKPENVLVDAMGRARVTDFGVATMRGLERMTQSGALVGTPFYMAPEQLGGKREAVGPHTDVWALGVMLYEAINGLRPFEGASLFDLASQLDRGVPPSDPLPGTPPAVLPVVERALNPTRAARYPHAGALLRDLDAALAGERVSQGRSVWLWVLCAVVLALAGAAGLFAFAVDAPPEPKPGVAPPPRGDPALRRWGQIRGAAQGALLLEAGEEWLETFPASALREEVLGALVAQRMAEPRWVHSVHRGRVRLASSATEFAAADESGGVSLGAWEDRQRTRRQVFAAWPVFLASSPAREGFWAAVAAGEGEVVFLQAEGDADVARQRLPLTWRPSGVQLSGDGELLGISNRRRTSVYRAGSVASDALAAQPLASVEQPQPPVDVAFLDDGSAFALALVEPGFATLDSLQVVSLSDYSILGRAELAMEPMALEALPGGRLALASEIGQILVFDRRANYLDAFEDPDLREREAPNTLAQMFGDLGNDGRVYDLALAPGGLLYSVGDHGSSEESAIRVWDVATRKLLRLQVVPRAYRACCLSSDGRYLACATEEGVIEVWDRWLPDEWSP